MRIAVGVFILAAALGVAQAGETGWRSDGTGRYPDAEPPVTFAPEVNVVWAAPLPSWSNASPVVIEDRIFVCAEPDTLIAVEKKTGKILWQEANPVAETSSGEDGAAQGEAKAHAHNGFTSATPVCDGKHVFAVFGNGMVAAYDLDGARRWSRFVEQPTHKWGHSASPILVGGKLLVHIHTLRALDPADGKELWNQPEETWGKPRDKRWGSPAPARIGEVDVVVTTSGRVIRASDGEVLFRDLPGVKYSTPLVDGDIVYFIDQKVGRAVRLPESLEGEPEVLWTAQTAKERYYASPVLHDGLIYAISRKGEFSAFDTQDGQEVYREKLLLAATEKEKNAAYASVTLAGKLLYFAGMDGSIVVAKPGRVYEQVARNTVEQRLRSTPIFEGTRVYVRAPEHLYCFGE